MYNSIRFRVCGSLLFACATLLASGTACAELRGLYNFDGDLTEATGNQDPAVFNGAGATFVDGRNSETDAVALNGSSEFITIGRNRDFGLSDGSFTVTAWIRPDVVDAASDDTILGNPQTVAGSLHLILRNTVPHFGMYSNDTAGIIPVFPEQWVHIAWVYDVDNGGVQRMYVNGLPDRGNSEHSNTLIPTNPLNIGQWGNTDHYFDGAIDQIAIWDEVLTEEQLVALATEEATPTTIPPAGDRLIDGPDGGEGFMGVRMIYGHGHGMIVNLGNAIAAADVPEGGDLVEGTAAVANFNDPEAMGMSKFSGDIPFVGNTALDDDDFVGIYNGWVRIDEAGPYTFGFTGDDGSRFRLVGVNFRDGGSEDVNNIYGFTQGDTIVNPRPTGNATTWGVADLEPGVYRFQHLHFERGGGASLEIVAAKGEHDSMPDGVRSPFRPLGYEAQGTFFVTGGTIVDGWEATVIRGSTVTSLDDGITVTREDADGTTPATDKTVETIDIINFADPENAGGGGPIPNGQPFPGNTDFDEDNFAVRATAQLEITDPGIYTFAADQDDGFLFRIIGVEGWDLKQPDTMLVAEGDGFRWNGCCAPRLASVHLDAGTYDVEYIMTEYGGAAYADLMAAYGDFDSVNGQFVPLGANTAEEVEDVAGLPLVAGPGGGGDSDNDGIPDEEESTHGTDPSNPDTDNDGMIDGDEVAAGTDPLSGSSVFTVRSVSTEAGDFSITFASVEGKLYAVERVEDLTDINWTIVADDVPAATGSGTTTVVDTEADGLDQAFYRVRLKSN